MSDALFHSELNDNSRVIYTPSTFAKTALLNIQELGTLQARDVHVSKRENLNSFLFFYVHSGTGTLTYNDDIYELHPGDCVFIDCRLPYAHETSSNLWKLSWIHFNGPTATTIYNKYIERGGQPVFHPANITPYINLYSQLNNTLLGNSYIRDIEINACLSQLITLIMQESWHPDLLSDSRKKRNINEIKEYLDTNYTQKITLDELSERYYINKYYLTRVFKEQFGVSINTYLLNRRITLAKSELRFTEKSIDEIGILSGIGPGYYFSRVFKQVEGIAPSDYRNQWQ